MAAFLLLTGCASLSNGSDRNGWSSGSWEGDFEEGVEEDPFLAEEEVPDENVKPSFAEICVRKKTMVRAAYRSCDDAEKGHAWYYLSLDAEIPATGGKARSGTFELPGYDGVRVSGKGGRGRKIALPLDDGERIEICVRTRTRVRTDDGYCDDIQPEKGYAWYYLPFSRRVPRLNAKAEHGTYRYSPHQTAFRARPEGGKGKAAIAEETEERPTIMPTPRTCRTPNIWQPKIYYCS
ncbi:hypothetical protein [Nonomuraea jiangxiensis]|nr:hypothetical protein [Nonomuraea jiangxiensis]